MKRSKRPKNPDCTPPADIGRRRWFQLAADGEEGQGLLEAAVAFVFLLTILLVMFEMALVFSSYIALLNCAVQGAVYARSYPDMVSEPPDAHYLQYERIIRNEAMGGGLSYTELGIRPPQLSSSGETMTVTVHYSMTTFASEMIFPMFGGRFGLPNRYYISARTAVRTFEVR